MKARKFCSDHRKFNFKDFRLNSHYSLLAFCKRRRFLRNVFSSVNLQTISLRIRHHSLYELFMFFAKVRKSYLQKKGRNDDFQLLLAFGLEA